MILEAEALRRHDHFLALGEDHRPSVTLDLQHGLRKGIVTALCAIAGLHHRDRSRCVAHQHGGRILTAGLRVALLRLAGQVRHFAEEVAGQVEDVDADVLDDQLLLFRQIGLAAIDVEASAPRKPGPGGRADGALVENLLHRAHGGGKTEILVHGQPGLVFPGRLDDGDAVIPGGCEGLLHHCRHAAFGRDGGQRLVGIHAGGNVEEVDLHRVEHAPHVGEVRDAESLSGGGGAGLVTVADGGKDRTLRLQVGPGVEMVLGIEAAPHHADCHRLLRRHDSPPHLAKPIDVYRRSWRLVACNLLRLRTPPSRHRRFLRGRRLRPQPSCAPGHAGPGGGTRGPPRPGQ